MSNKKTTILVSSCDFFSDVWKPMICAFFQNWEDCPYPIYFVSNFKELDDKRVNFIKVGKDISYGTNLRKALDQIDADYIIYFMEDYFLDAKVNTSDIEKHVDYCENHGINFMKLASDNLVETRKDVVDGIYRKNPMDNKYAINTVVAIWTKKMLYDLTLPEYSPWDFERNVVNYVNENNYPANTLVLAAEEFREHGIPYMEVVRRGKWISNVIPFLKKNGFEEELKNRKHEPEIIHKFASYYHPNSWTKYIISGLIKTIQFITK